MLILTTSYYNPAEYEPIGLINGLSVHSISALRGLFAGISGVFGGKQEMLEKKFLDIREEAIKSLEENAVKMGADMVVALKLETSELGSEYLVFNASGTGLRKIKKGGKKIYKK